MTKKQTDRKIYILTKCWQNHNILTELTNVFAKTSDFHTKLRNIYKKDVKNVAGNDQSQLDSIVFGEATFRSQQQQQQQQR